MMGNFYLLHRSAGWAAVCISKNACTSLKKAVLEAEGDRRDGVDAIHHRIGYSSRSPYLHPVREGKPPGFFTFAVWRDPVDRFRSTLRQMEAGGYRGCREGLPSDAEGWIRFAERELSKPVLQQDEHLRRQSDYYTADQVDAIIAIEDLNCWFESRGWGTLGLCNRRAPCDLGFTAAEADRIRRLYSADYDLIEPAIHVGRSIPAATGSAQAEPAAATAHRVIAASIVERRPCGERPASQLAKAEGVADPGRILVGVCSCRKNEERRRAIRETWASRAPAGIEVVFFVGEGPEPIEAVADVVVVAAPDDYGHLPAKVLAFFRHSLDACGFDWLFKCDDDTYVALGRLGQLATRGQDLIGNEFLTERGSPSGGAGYMLSRGIVARVAGDRSIPPEGDEDVLIGRAAIRHGASFTATRRLCSDTSRYPCLDNDVITSHWCSPERLRLLDRIARSRSQETVEAVHPFWHDTLYFHPNGVFRRKSTPCVGTWSQDGDFRRLDWLDWGVEWMRPETAAAPGPAEPHPPDGTVQFRFVRKLAQSLTVELRGGLGNQMFQYAHGLALASRFRIPLRLSFANYGRPFGLGIFKLALDARPERSCRMIECNGSYIEGQEWPSATAIMQGGPGHVRLAGYFQNENYFLPVAEVIREQFRLVPRTLPEVAGRSPVCVHVRRGDFVGNPVHGLCSIDYYHTAMRLMRSMIERPVFVILSDDPGWCARHFGREADALVADAPAEPDALAVMCGCTAFVLSNSTFGWWGAWLADATPVIAPNKFLNGQSWDICPKRWITIPASGIPSTPGCPTSTPRALDVDGAHLPDPAAPVTDGGARTDME